MVLTIGVFLQFYFFCIRQISMVKIIFYNSTLTPQKAGQINNVTTDVLISKARKEGRTMAFNLNSLLIKPVQRITKYPLILQQVSTK
jgi:hypothetical protein